MTPAVRTYLEALRAKVAADLAADAAARRAREAHARLTPAERAELDAFYASRRDGFAAAEKAAKKSPRKPRPSECWTVRESPRDGQWSETFRGGKVDAERRYREIEKGFV